MKSGKIDRTGAGGDLAEGHHATIIASVWAWITGADDRIDFCYASDASNPDWQFIATLTSPNGRAQELKIAYTLPQGSIQAAHVGMRYRGSQSPCATENYNDRDDIFFKVQPGTASPTKAPMPGGTPQVALYDDTLGIPSCSKVGNQCDSDTLLASCGNVGPELNKPNTLGTCGDGNTGSYFVNESIEKIVVRSGKADGTYSEVDLTEGDHTTIIASVHAYGDGSSDHADFYYTSDVNNPIWVFIDTVDPPKGGANELKVSFILPQGANQAVRVNI